MDPTTAPTIGIMMRSFAQFLIEAEVPWPQTATPEEQAQVRTYLAAHPDIAQWVHGTQVVDHDGYPRLCYHGTQRPQAPLVPTGAHGQTLGPGVYVTYDRTYAARYGTVLPVLVAARTLISEETMYAGIGAWWRTHYADDEDYDFDNPQHVRDWQRAATLTRRAHGADGIWGTIDGKVQIAVTPAQVHVLTPA